MIMNSLVRIKTSVRVHIYLVGNRSRTPRAHVRCLIDKTQVDHCIKTTERGI